MNKIFFELKIDYGKKITENNYDIWFNNDIIVTFNGLLLKYLLETKYLLALNQLNDEQKIEYNKSFV